MCGRDTYHPQRVRCHRQRPAQCLKHCDCDFKAMKALSLDAHAVTRLLCPAHRLVELRVELIRTSKPREVIVAHVPARVQTVRISETAISWTVNPDGGLQLRTIRPQHCRWYVSAHVMIVQAQVMMLPQRAHDSYGHYGHGSEDTGTHHSPVMSADIVSPFCR